MLERNTFTIERSNAYGSDELTVYLKKLLPFSVNMIAAVRDYPDRCTVLIARRRKSIAGVMVEFHSRYNRHIWFDPIIWIAGNADAALALFHEKGSGPSIIISQTDFTNRGSTRKIELKVYEEYIMVANLDNVNLELRTGEGELKRLTVYNKIDSLAISGVEGKEMDQDSIEREENFLKERVCMGLFVDGKLVSRGAVMSITDDYASVGAFLTDRGSRNMGYGSRIVAQTLRRASVYSRNACLFVRASNENAIQLYRKVGFEINEKAYFIDVGTGSMP